MKKFISALALTLMVGAGVLSRLVVSPTTAMAAGYYPNYSNNNNSYNNDGDYDWDDGYMHHMMYPYNQNYGYNNWYGYGTAYNTYNNVQRDIANMNYTQNKVSISNSTYQPRAIVVKPGTTVTWTNNDSAAHTVTADHGAFNSGDIMQGKTYSYTFNQAGTYAYHCSVHPDMRGMVVVK